MTARVFRYAVDAGDRISFVSDDWLAFATENDTPELSRERVVGRPLWSFIAGLETRHLYGLLFDRARREQREVRIPFRCDSSTTLRHMELGIAPRSDRGLDLTGTLVREAPRTYVGLLDPGVARGQDMLTICSWCKRVLLPPDEWVDTEEAIRRLRLFDTGDLPRLSHGVCGPCEKAVTEAYDID